jgi:hypothetical protein
MVELNVRRLTGAFGIGAFVIFLIALPLYFLLPPAVLPQEASFTDYVTRTSTFVVTRATLADPLIISCFLVFLGGLRQLIIEARRDFEWIATLIFGIAVLYVGLQLVADALQGAGALDAAVGANPSTVRALFKGSVPLYSSIGLVPAGFLLAFAGYATSTSGVLPKWTGWVAYAGSIIILADAPTIYLGFSGLTFGISGLFAGVAEFWMPLWILIASVIILRKRVPAPQ